MAALAPYTRREREAALGRLMRYAQGPDLEHSHEVAQLLFWGTDDEEIIAFAVEQAPEQIEIMYNSWFSFDVNIDEGKSPLELFLEDRGRSLTRGERNYLERMRETHLRPYEVLAVERDRGLTLRDLWSGEERQVREKAATRGLALWDVLAARLLEVEPGVHVLEGGVYPFPVKTKEGVLAEFRHWHKKFRKSVPDATDDLFFKRTGFLFHHLWLKHVVLRPLPEIRTPEGAPVEFARLSFAVQDAAALRDALDRHSDLEAGNDDGEWVWIEPAEGRIRILGSIRLVTDRLELEVMSRPRAERGRKLLDEAAGPALRYQATVIQDLEQALRECPGEREAPSEPDIPPEERERILREFFDRHYRQWLDDSVPALGDRTPRESVGRKKDRGRVVELLKMMENRHAHAVRRGEPGYDMGWVWEELGLERP